MFQRGAIVSVCLLTACAAVFAERLPIRVYTGADGFPHTRVRCIMRDSRGFLWFCADDRISRFDGYRFVNYDVGGGPTSIVEGNPGNYWIGTYGNGVSRLSLSGSEHEGGKSKLTRFVTGEEQDSNLVNVIYRDRKGRLWAGTDNELYLLDEAAEHPSFRRIELGLPRRPGSLIEVGALVEDPDGSLWIGTADGLVRRLPDGRMVHYIASPPEQIRFVRALLLDRNGWLWLGHTGGLTVFRPEPARDVLPGFSSRPLATGPEAVHWFKRIELAGIPPIWALRQFADGTIMAGTYGGGVLVFDGTTVHRYTIVHGLSDDIVFSLAEDVEGNRWLGTSSGGVLKLANRGFTGFRQADGLAAERVLSIFETLTGELCVVGRKWHIGVFGGRRFSDVQLKLPPAGSESPSAGQFLHPAIQDHTGEWWIASGRGVYRFSATPRLEDLVTMRPKAIYTTRDGLASNVADGLYEDPQGNIWIGMTNSGLSSSGVVARWKRSAQSIQVYSASEGIPPFARPRRFIDDGAGDIWVGLWEGGLLRFTNGRFTLLRPADGVAQGVINNFFRDSSGRLWMASSLRGVSRIDNPAAEHPHFTTYTTDNGLASNDVGCITEDRNGRLYIGTSRGVDRLDPSTGRIRHYAGADGIEDGDVTAAFRDRSGSLWFGTYHNVSRLSPQTEEPDSPPSVWISGIRVGGISKMDSEFGEAHPGELRLSSRSSHVRVEFFGLSFDSGGPLRYQYKLGTDGAAAGWSAPSEERGVDFANLGPGHYEFAVRAINADALASDSPAILSVAVPSPVWQRWWFLSLTALSLASGAYLLDRHRLARLLELERVRTRIATDLHDDIGSSLTQISVLSEVIRQRTGDEPAVTEPLTKIGDLSRDLIDSLGEIVWAINPRHDSFSDLTQRMRRFGSDYVGGPMLDYRFQATAPRNDLKIGADMRREIFLIFKESVTNALRHSKCARVEIAFTVKHGWIELQVTDDGTGFDSRQSSEGTGLASMRQRAARLAGTLEVRSTPGAGTFVWLRVPATQPGPVRASLRRLLGYISMW
jgi:signal transduction histidine kinase/ligand-binding sensor domain-containing protein